MRLGLVNEYMVSCFSQFTMPDFIHLDTLSNDILLNAKTDYTVFKKKIKCTETQPSQNCVSLCVNPLHNSQSVSKTCSGTDYTKSKKLKKKKKK
jgi:hypothetical protein